VPTRFVDHRGRQIVLMDFSRLPSIEESLVHIEEARKFVASQPKVMNLRVVVDVTDSPFDNSVIEALQRLADHDRPWVLVSATVGLSPIRAITNRLIAMKSHRKFGRFKDLGRALDWVAQQEGPPAEFPDEAD
jgi:hypothetical protein